MLDTIKMAADGTPNPSPHILNMMDSTTVQPNNQTPFQRFLLANRPYCEICTGPYPSTKIIKHKGHDTAVCDSHYIAFTTADRWSIQNPQHNETDETNDIQ